MSNGRLGLRTRPGVIRTYTEGAVDSDVVSFLNATGINDITQINAITQLVADLKNYGLWAKMKAIYPFVGGEAAQHKFNLKDARDLDAAFRLQFFGGWTHSSNGATPNGTNAYANSFLTPSVSLATNSMHFSKYNRTNDLVGNKIDGVYDGIGPFYLQQNYSAANSILGDLTSLISYTQTDTRGLFTATRTSTNVSKVFKNSTQQGSTNTSTITAIPSSPIYIGGRNANNTGQDLYNTYQCAFASIGDGLDDTEVANLYTAVNTFQTTLSRNV